MSGVQIEQNSYEMHPRNLAHCQRRGGLTPDKLTVTLSPPTRMSKECAVCVAT